MKNKLITILCSLFCVSCADMNVQMDSLRKNLSEITNQRASGVSTSNNDSDTLKKNDTNVKSSEKDTLLNWRDAQVALDCGTFILGASSNKLVVSQRIGNSVPVKILNYDEKNKVYEFVVLGATSFGPTLADSYKLDINKKTLESIFNKPSNEPRPPRFSKCESLKTKTSTNKTSSVDNPNKLPPRKKSNEEQIQEKNSGVSSLVSNRKNFRELVAQSKFAYDCGGASTYFLFKDSFQVFDTFYENKTDNFHQFKFDKDLMYFSTKDNMVSYVLDLKESKLVMLVKPANTLMKESTLEQTCKKLK
jgi:hypothetical protein